MALAAAVTMVMARRYSVCYNVRGLSIIMAMAVVCTMKVVLCLCIHRGKHASHHPRDTKSTYSLGRRVKELSRNEQPSVIPRKQLRIYSDSIRARRCVLIRIGASVYALVIFSQSPQDRSGDREHRGGLARSKSKVDSFLREVIINVIQNISQESTAFSTKSTFSQRVRKIVISTKVSNT